MSHFDALKKHHTSVQEEKSSRRDKQRDSFRIESLLLVLNEARSGAGEKSPYHEYVARAMPYRTREFKLEIDLPRINCSVLKVGTDRSTSRHADPPLVPINCKDGN